MGDLLYFSATDPEFGQELFRSDGTAEGTYMVKDIYTASVLEEDLLKVAEQLNHPNFRQKLNSTDVFACSRVELDYLIQKILHFKRSTGENRAFHQREMLIQLVQLVWSGGKKQRSEINTNRQRIISATENLVLSRADAPPSIEEICKAIGVSKRALQYTFSDVYQVTPKFYTKAIRYNEVYRALKYTPSSKAKIADIANAWGFWHMGQFAADYRKLFGELPSDTLKGSRANPQGINPW